MYKKAPLDNWGVTVPRRHIISRFPHVDINLFHSVLTDMIWNNKERKKNTQNNIESNAANNKINSYRKDNNFETNESKISIYHRNIENKTNTKSASTLLPEKIEIKSSPIYTQVADNSEYIVDEIFYDGVECYKLTKTVSHKFVYTQSDRQKFRTEIVDKEYCDYSEQQKNELIRLIEYWADHETTYSQTYIISKKNFAILSFLSESKYCNSKGEWMTVQKIMERYEKGTDKKYHQVHYSKLVRNYIGGYPNTDNVYTVIIRTPTEKKFCLGSLKTIPRNLYLTYEDFCEEVDEPDEEMLLDWNNYKKE